MSFAEFAKLMKHVAGPSKHIPDRQLEHMFQEVSEEYALDDGCGLTHDGLVGLAEVCLKHGVVAERDTEDMVAHLMDFVFDNLTDDEAVLRIQRVFRGFEGRDAPAKLRWKEGIQRTKAATLIQAAFRVEQAPPSSADCDAIEGDNINISSSD